MSSQFKISERAAAIRGSATLAMAAKAGELRAQGHRVFDFSAGEPDFKPPAAVRRELKERLSEQPVHYAPVPGLPQLRDVVARQMSEYHGVAFGREHVLVSCGAKHALANLFSVGLSPGDEVVIAAPYWVSYPDMVRLAGGVPVIATTRREQGWRLQVEELERVVRPTTRMLVLNSPSNPTGAGYDAATLRALVSRLVQLAPEAWIVFDDIYRTLVYGGFEHASGWRVLADLTDRVIAIDGVSKSHAMTGFRIGFLLAPAPVIAAAARVQGQTTSGAATHSQYAALVALSDPSVEADVGGMKQAFVGRRERMLAGLSTIPRLDMHPPEGAFYVFVDIQAYLGSPSGGRTTEDDVALATWLLENHHVATVPGSAFGAPGYLRLSYATDERSIDDGLARMAEAFSKLPVVQ